MRIFAIVLIAAAAYAVALCTSLIIKLNSDGLWNDPNGRKIIIGIVSKGLFALILAMHFTWMAWRKKPAASVK